MRRVIVVACAVALVAGFGAGRASADMDSHMDGVAVHNSIGLGFHNTEAPIGVRWWFAGQKVGLDLGIGVTNIEAEDASSLGPGFDPDDPAVDDETIMGWALDVGVPLVLRSWPKAHFMVRPGLLFTSQEVPFDEDLATPGVQFDTESETSFAVRSELEGEVFLADNVSVSASHGLQFTSSTPADFPGFAESESSTTFSTFGRNFTTVGFHWYLWGPYTH